MSTYKFEDVVRLVSQPDIAGTFPPDILRNRLIGMGGQQIVEEGAIQQFGFPLRYHYPLDEAILVLHYFLTKSNLNEGSHVRINSIHVPTKEEENNLSFWKSPKSGLYLDLHSLIENNNWKRSRSGLVKRIFVFRDNAHLSFLDSTGIGVMLEQQSIGIKTGFVLKNHQEPHRAGLLEGGAVLIQLLHSDEEKCEWALIIDKTHSTSQPYANQMVCKWYKGRVLDPETRSFVASDQVPIDVEAFIKLFEFDDVPTPNKIGKSSYRFGTTLESFSDLLKSNFRASFRFEGQGEPRSYYDEQFKTYEKQFEVKTIPDTLQQFFQALTKIKESKQVKAIDASSVKSTLKIHEADPNYRHWIRATVNLAIHDPDACLERIYILDMDEQKKDYKVFEQEVGLYRDLIANKISKLDEVWPLAANVAGADDSPDQQAYRDNIKIYAITKRAIQAFCQTLPQDKQEALLPLLVDVFVRDASEGGRKSGDATSLINFYMRQLDILFSENLVFNYKDYKGEPGQSLYDAELFVLCDRSRTEENVGTFLEKDQFQAKQSIYARLFELLKSLSVRVLPPEENGPSGGNSGVPTPDVLENKLRERRRDYLNRLNREPEQEIPAQQVSDEDVEFEMAYVLFMDIVGFSLLPEARKPRAVQQLNDIVRSTDEFRRAEAEQRLLRLPTGDGIALAFFTNPVSASRCAVQLSQALRLVPEIPLRMGINDGFVSRVHDINDNKNIAGGGIDNAQRVMDIGDAGHIIVSQSVAKTLKDLASRLATGLQDLGEVEVKHGVRMHVYNLNGDDYGNPATPQKASDQRKPAGDLKDEGS